LFLDVGLPTGIFNATVISLFLLFILQGGWSKFAKGKRPPRVMYDRLLALAAHSLAEVNLHCIMLVFKHVYTDIRDKVGSK